MAEKTVATPEVQKTNMTEIHAIKSAMSHRRSISTRCGMVWWYWPTYRVWRKKRWTYALTIMC